MNFPQIKQYNYKDLFSHQFHIFELNQNKHIPSLYLFRIYLILYLILCLVYHCIIKNERIKCTEALFNPSFFSNDDDKLNIKSDKESNICEKDKGLGYACFDSIQKCEIDVRKDLYNCIVLSGGNSMFNGLKERLTKEIKMLAPESMKEEVKVIASPERKIAAWVGASIFASLSYFITIVITKAEYEESGVAIVHKKIQ